ncbi:MAG: RimK family alpha-L-glutamate ligase [Planctomycetota bacterium]
MSDLRRAAGDAYDLQSAPFSRIASAIGVGGVGVASGESPLSDADAVLVRTMPPGSLEQVVFRMDALAQLEAAGVVVMNPARAIEAAVDKYLATARLHAVGLPTPTTHACQTVDDAMTAFDALGGRAVLKPIFGGEGRGVTLLDDAAMARRAFALLEQLGAVILLQEFVPSDAARGAVDYRLLVIGDRVLGIKRVSDGDWRTNVSLGGRAEPLEVTGELAELAHRAAAAVGAPLAGIDVLPARDGRRLVLEVNAVPGWRALTRVTGVDVARLVLELLKQKVVA